MRRTRLGLLAALLLHAAAARGGDVATARVDDVFAAWDSPATPGCALGVVQDGRLVLRRGYGMASLEHHVPNSTRAVYYIASTSKQFVAAAVLLAAEQGFLNLDDDVRRWVPELPTWGAPITLRHLIHHTSGLRDDLTLMYLADMPYENVTSSREILALLARQRALNFPPGSAFGYSNSGYFLLAEIVHRATGSTLRQFAERNLFSPLAMTATHFHDDRTEVVPDRAVAYAPGDDGTYRLQWYLNFDQVGSGGLLTTVEDLARWDANFYADALGLGGLAAALQTRGRLANGEPLDYSAGLYLGSYRGLPTVRHAGGFMGFRAELLRFPEEHFSVICLCNAGDAVPARLAERVADLYLADAMGPRAPADEEAPPPATAPAPSTGSAGELTAFAGRYHSAELDVDYALEVEAPGLRLQVGDSGETVELQPVARDVLQGEEFELHFSRRDGLVDGFELRAWGVRGLRFDRRRDR
jgi:CubicO group peptidase (beta-lactamase class C family)